MTIQTINQFVNQYFAWVLLISAGLGLVLPGVDQIPQTALVWFMAVQVFLSSFKISPNEIKQLHFYKMSVFLVLRFIALPALWGLLLLWFNNDYVLAIFLMLLLPVGVSAPAIAAILGASVSLTILLVVSSSLAAPFVIPLMFEVFTQTTLSIDTWAMFQTLVVMVIIPIALHLPLRRSATTVKWVGEYGQIIAILLVALTMMTAAAGNREYLLHNWFVPLVTYGMGLLVFLSFYLLAWGFFYKESAVNRLSYTLGSGLNNAMMGVVLAVLYFSEVTTIFMVIGNVAWLTALVIFRAFYARRQTHLLIS